MGKPLTSGEVTHHTTAQHDAATVTVARSRAPHRGAKDLRCAAPTAARHHHDHRYRPVGVGGGLRSLEIGREMGSQVRLWSGLFRRLSIEERWISKAGFGRWSCGARHGVRKPLSVLRGKRAGGARVMGGLGSVCCRMKISLPFWQHFEGGEGLSLLSHGGLGPAGLITGHAFGLDPLRGGERGWCGKPFLQASPSRRPPAALWAGGRSKRI
jgi:hypothetical protein